MGSGGKDDQDPEEVKPPFCQMDVLYHYEDGVSEWRETARWVKYEEKVEIGKRWSKPHVATLSLHALFQFRQCVAQGTVLLDIDEQTLPDITNRIVEDIRQQKGLSEDECSKLRHILLQPHKHKNRKGKKKTHGDTEFTAIAMENGNGNNNSAKFDASAAGSNGPPSAGLNGSSHASYNVKDTSKSMAKYKSNKRLGKKIPKGSGAANILVGKVEFLAEPVVALVRVAHPALLADLTEVATPTRFIFVLLGPPESQAIWEYEEVGRAAASLMTDKIFSEIAENAETRDALLEGIDEFIDDLTVLPPSIWDPETRLPPPDKVPTGHGPSSKVTVRVRRRTAQQKGELPASDEDVSKEQEAGVKGDDEKEEQDMALQRTGKFFGGFVLDIKRRYPFYWSDIRDAMNLQTLAATIFLYFACITPIVTFGGLLGKATDNYLGVTESIMSGCLCGITYHLFAGQPLTILGATGPLLVFEEILYNLCKDYGFDFMSFRFWSGAWCALFLLLMVAFDLSALVRYITRFTEECFSVLISVIFIYEAVNKLLSVDTTHPIQLNPRPDYTCHCILPDCADVDEALVVNGTGCLNSNSSIDYKYSTVSLNKDCFNYKSEVMISAGCIFESQCEAYSGNLTGPACHDEAVTHAVPDVFLMSILLFLVVFCVAYALQSFRHSRYLTQFVRNIVADFAVTIGVITAVGIDAYIRIGTPKLNVPPEVKPSNPNRGWVVNPMTVTYWWLTLLGAVPGILVTILIFLDQQITSVIVNRKENKLKKGCGYHLDLFILALLILVCSLLGLPWFVAATVRSITHARSLMVQSEASAPGEKPQFLGIREQRMSGLCIHILIGVSVFLTVVLKLIPMPVLYGVFMYMGVMSLRGVQFIQRILIIFMPKKYQPDYIYLRHVRTWRTHMFTIIQIVCMVVMWVVKSTKVISILFPLTILALVIVRKIMGRIFNSYELEWLDDLSPDELRRAKEDAEKKSGRGAEQHVHQCDVNNGKCGGLPSGYVNQAYSPTPIELRSTSNTPDIPDA